MLFRSKAIAVYRDVQGMLNAGLIQPPGEMEASDVFQSNRVAMVYAGSWWALPFSQNELIKDHIGVVPMPKMAEQAGVSHSLAFAMSAKSQHKDAAWKFIEFMSSEHAQQTLATGKVVIPANQKVAKEWAEGFKGIDVSAYIDSLAFSHKYPTAGSNTAKWNSILNDGLKKVWTGTDPEKVMPGVAVLGLACVVGGVISSQGSKFFQSGIVIFVAVLLHNGFGYFLGYCAGKLTGMNTAKKRTISIEVGMQNAGLATNLATTTAQFASTPESAIICAVSCVWHSISGTLLAGMFAQYDKIKSGHKETATAK